MQGCHLFKLYRPVGVIEELFPAFVSRVCQMSMEQYVVFWFYWFANQFQVSLFWHSTPFSGIAFDTGADNVFPVCFAAETSGYYMVKGKFAGWNFLGATF